MNLATWTPSLLPAVVRFWNRAFAAKRNFFPVTAELFRRRVVEKRTPAERFDPKGLIVAREGGEVVGLVHAGVRREEVCRALDPRWPGGTQGVIYFLYVEPEHRRRGLGGELWHRAVGRLKGTGQVVLDGQCLNPFYGNSEGPFTPFWGTPEGVGVEWTDSATQKFLARKGFAPRFKAVQFVLALGAGDPEKGEGEGPPRHGGTENPEKEGPQRRRGTENPEREGSRRHGETERRGEAEVEEAGKALSRLGFELRCVGNEYPQVGKRCGERRPVAPGLVYECATAVRRGRTAGLVSYFPMGEVREGLYAVYEAEVVEELRGRALGRHLLAAAIGRMRARGGSACEALTIPELSPAAVKLYGAAGFQRAAGWAIY